MRLRRWPPNAPGTAESQGLPSAPTSVHVLPMPFTVDSPGRRPGRACRPGAGTARALPPDPLARLGRIAGRDTPIPAFEPAPALPLAADRHVRTSGRLDVCPRRPIRGLR